MLKLDATIRDCGLAEASRLSLQPYVRELRVFGRDHVPDSAFLALCNHPGMSDTLSLFAAINRPDIRIIALDRPFLRAVPNMSRQLFYVKDDPAARMGLVRQVTSHLRTGGAALTFPAGHIEPDPDLRRGAVESLHSWTDSVGVFARMAPEAAILPVLVRGVVWKGAAHHPLLQIKRTRAEREKLAAALQLLHHIAWNLKLVTVRVQIGRPIHARDLSTTDAVDIHQAALNEMRQMIENPPNGEGVRLL
jgi:putative hemolysin